MDITSFLQKLDAVIINPVLALLFAVAFIMFVISVIRLINAEANKKAEARNALMWSIVGMFIMISVYGILNLVLNTFGVNNTPSTTFIQGNLNGK